MGLIALVFVVVPGGAVVVRFQNVSTRVFQSRSNHKTLIFARLQTGRIKERVILFEVGLAEVDCVNVFGVQAGENANKARIIHIHTWHDVARIKKKLIKIEGEFRVLIVLEVECLRSIEFAKLFFDMVTRALKKIALSLLGAD